MSQPPKTLEVILQGRRVGYLTNLADDASVFAFDPEYAEDPNRPTLSLSFLDETGAINMDTVHKVRRLAPPYFSNLLPEGALRPLIARKLKVSEDRDFPLLQSLGGDLPGAVVLGSVEPVDPPPGDALTYSLPGVQLKLSALLSENDGLTIPAHGAGGNWIVKLSSGKFAGLVENEFSMLEFARLLGITVPSTRLVDPREITGLPADFTVYGPALAIERFDRGPNATRIHTEEFNQVFSQFPHDKYENRTYGDVAKIVYRHAGQEDAYDLVRRLIFTAAIGNGDAHLKNWSLIYADGRTPRLAPAYDYLSTFAYEEVDHNLALSFGESKALNGFTEDRLRRFARSADLPLKLVKDAVTDTIDALVQTEPSLDELPMFDDQRELVRRHIAKLRDELKPLHLKGVREGVEVGKTLDKGPG